MGSKILGVINGLCYLLSGVLLVAAGLGIFGDLEDMSLIILGAGAGAIVLAMINIFFAVKSEAMWGCVALLILGFMGIGVLNIIAAFLGFRRLTAEERAERREERREERQFNREIRKDYYASLSKKEKAQYKKLKVGSLFAQVFFIILAIMHNLIFWYILSNAIEDYIYNVTDGYIAEVTVVSERVMIVGFVLYIISAIIMYALKGGTPFFSDDYKEITVTKEYTWQDEYLSDGRWVHTGTKEDSKDKTIWAPNPILILYLVFGTISLFTHIIGFVILLCFRPGNSIYPCNNIYTKLPRHHKNGWFLSAITSFFFGFVFVNKGY